jgi:hypothetical protein
MTPDQASYVSQIRRESAKHEAALSRHGIRFGGGA